GDLVGAAEMVRRRWRNLVELRPDVAVILDNLEPGREWVLDVIHDPHAAAFVEADVQRLPHFGLGRDQVDRQVVLRFEFLQRLQCGKWLAPGKWSVQVPQCVVQSLGLWVEWTGWRWVGGQRRDHAKAEAKGESDNRTRKRRETNHSRLRNSVGSVASGGIW